MTTATINDTDITVRVGSRITPDNWPISSGLIASNWEQADFRLPSINNPNIALAVRVRITGTTLQRRNGCSMIRVQITWVGDGEPDRTSGGWLAV